MKYVAFISYRHGGIDELVGTKIQRELERYRLPSKIAKSLGKKSLGKVFRDADDLRAASNLSEIIREGLDDSEYLIVICTRRYKESVWCMDEIEYFMQIRGRDNIIVVLVEGEPEESFPKLLTEYEKDGEIIHIEPLAVDVRADSQKEILKLVSREKLRYISQILNLDYDDLRQRQRERQRKRITAAASAVVIGLSVFIGVVTRKNIQLNAAYDSLDESMQHTLKGQSYYLAEYAAEAYENGDRSTAALLALEALPQNLSEPERPFVPSVMRSLTDALGVYDFSSGYQADKVYTFEQESYQIKTEISPDGKKLLVEQYQTTAGNMLKGTVTVYEMATKRQLYQAELNAIRKTSLHQLSHCAYFLKNSQGIVYLSQEGLCAFDFLKRKALFQAEKGDQLVLSDERDLVALYNTETAVLSYYDMEGKRFAVTELDTDKKYNLYCVSPDDSIAVLSQDAENEVGIMLTDTHTGGVLFIDKGESCSQISFINDHSICFKREDSQIGRSHIVVNDLNENTDDYLVDTDEDIDGFEVSDYESCFFFQGKKLYEISSKTGKIRWKKTYSSEVISTRASGDYLAVTLKNGRSYFYNSREKELINTVSGNGQSYYMLAFSEKYACMADFWGQNIRIYTPKKNARENVETLDIGTEIVSASEKWYTAAADGDYFMLDFKNGLQDQIAVFSSQKWKRTASSTLKDMEYESFDNLSVEASAKGYIAVQDYAYGENAHFAADTMKKVFSFSEDDYYFYNEDKSSITVAEGKKLTKYDCFSGDETETETIPDGYNRGVICGSYKIFGSDTFTMIQKDGTEGIILQDAQIYTINEKQELLFYRNQSGDRWFVYSLPKNKIVCEGKAGNYACTMFFDNGRYFLNDYTAVYDTVTWKKVLDLSDISTGVYGVATTEKLPYFVVWYQSGSTASTGKSVGSNTAYLYSKENPEDIVGVIPNYVATSSDGRVIVYDGNHTLYKIPLYSTKELVQRAKEYVKGISLTEKQKEAYHIYNE